MKSYEEWLAEVEEKEDKYLSRIDDEYTIVNQHKIYVYGEMYIVDEYADNTFGINDYLFADSIDELKKMIKREVSHND